MVSERAYHLTPEQFKAVISDDAAYWAFECLVNERGALTPKVLADAAGESEAKIVAGLKRLAKHKLAKPAGGGRWKSPLSGQFYVFPPTYPGIEPDQEKRRAIVDRMTKKKGRWLFRANVALRADEASIRRSVGGFTDAMEGASAYCVYEKGEDTGLYQVETRIRLILPF